MADSGFTGWEDPGLGAALRRLALDAPSAEHLLAAVLAASARATVRRRTLAASVAALTVVGVAVAVSAGGSTDPGGSELVLGASETPFPSTQPSPVPSDEPTPEPTGTSRATAPPVPPGTYAGRAVSVTGEPISALYVYVIGVPRDHGWTDASPLARTGADGRFQIPCPAGSVLLSAFLLDRPQDGSTRNWMATYVHPDHSGYPYATSPPCPARWQDMTVREGIEIHGHLRGPSTCDWSDWRIALFVPVVEDDTQIGNPVRDRNDRELREPVSDEGTFRIAGLPPTDSAYTLMPFRGGEGVDTASDGLWKPEPGEHKLDLEVPASECERATPEPVVS